MLLICFIFSGAVEISAVPFFILGGKEYVTINGSNTLPDRGKN